MTGRRMASIATLPLLLAGLCALFAPLAANASSSVPDAVFHHVSDSTSLEFEHPISGTTLVIHLPIIKVTVPESVPTIGGFVFDLSLTKHTIFMWVASIILVVGMMIAVRGKALVPSGFYSAMEAFVQFVRDELAVKNIGKHHADHYVPYLCTAFFFILTANLLGLVPYTATATGNLAVTLGLALTSLAVTLYAGMKEQGVVGYWLHLVPGGVPWWLWPIMWPIELIGILTKPFALMMRLFANMLAGHVVIYFLLGLIFLLGGIGAYIAPVSVAFATAIFMLEVFVAFLQAYIFTMLSALFIGLASHAH